MNRLWRVYHLSLISIFVHNQRFNSAWLPELEHRRYQMIVTVYISKVSNDTTVGVTALTALTYYGGPVLDENSSLQLMVDSGERVRGTNSPPTATAHSHRYSVTYSRTRGTGPRKSSQMMVVSNAKHDAQDTVWAAGADELQWQLVIIDGHAHHLGQWSATSRPRNYTIRPAPKLQY